jgi:hypothetical protein
MSAKVKLKRALSAIDDAKSSLERAKREAAGKNDQQIRNAISELDDAESYIKKAIRELPTE